MAIQSFYPNIGSLVNITDFPEELNFLEIGLENAMQKIYYKQLQYVKNNNGTQGYYNLVLITGEALKLNLMDTGLSIIVNPNNQWETIIPITLNYNWPILGLISNFNFQNFSFSPQEFKSLLDKSISFSDRDLLKMGVEIFEEDNLNILVDKINTKYNLSGTNSIPYPTQEEILHQVEEVLWTIENNHLITDDIKSIIDSIYLEDNDTNSFQRKLDKLSRNINAQSITDYIKELIIPKIDASLDISIGLAFPRKWLTPINSNTQEALPEPEQSILIFDVGTLLFSTKNGITFDEELSVSLNYPSEIGKTGLGINILKAKLDLSKNSNIIEAKLDGRPENFRGIYARKAAITLPSKWFNNVDNTTLQIIGYNMLVGTGGTFWHYSFRSY